MSGWLWLAFVVPLQFLCPNTGRGRVLTRWMHRRLFPRATAPLFRSLQVWALLFISIPFGHSRGWFSEPTFWDPRNVIFFVPVLALYLDDWLTGNDDDWKRRGDAVRNKIKWLMELPQPAPAGSRVAS